jgi:SAM-dependent methyltransferase
MDEAGPAFSNVYDDDERAIAYAALEYPGTYYLAYRDLPAIIAAHVTGREALDFGCGAGRSTRFLKRLGFSTTGIDISESMIRLARSADPEGRYHRVADGDLDIPRDRRFDLVLSAFAFDNIPGGDRRRDLLRGLGDTRWRFDRASVDAGDTGTVGVIHHERVPENRTARSGEPCASS